MRGPQPPAIELTEEERRELAALVRRRTTPQQVALRARLVLAAASGLNKAQVARQAGVDVETARHWRARWLGVPPVALAALPVEERRADAPRSGAPPRSTAAQGGQIVARAGAAPAAAGRPISPWTGRAVAAARVARGSVPAIAPRHAGRLRHRGTASRTACAPG